MRAILAVLLFFACNVGCVFGGERRAIFYSLYDGDKCSSLKKVDGVVVGDCMWALDGEYGVEYDCGSGVMTLYEDKDCAGQSLGQETITERCEAKTNLAEFMTMSTPSQSVSISCVEDFLDPPKGLFGSFNSLVTFEDDCYESGPGPEVIMVSGMCYSNKGVNVRVTCAEEGTIQFESFRDAECKDLDTTLSAPTNLCTSLGAFSGLLHLRHTNFALRCYTIE